MDNFSVKLLYKVVVGSNSVAFPHQLIWSTRFPPRWVFFFCLGRFLGQRIDS